MSCRLYPAPQLHYVAAEPVAPTLEAVAPTLEEALDSEGDGDSLPFDVEHVGLGSSS